MLGRSRERYLAALGQLSVAAAVLADADGRQLADAITLVRAAELEHARAVRALVELVDVLTKLDKR